LAFKKAFRTDGVTAPLIGLAKSKEERYVIDLLEMAELIGRLVKHSYTKRTW